MQDALFPDDPPEPARAAPAVAAATAPSTVDSDAAAGGAAPSLAPRRKRSAQVGPAPVDDATRAIAAALPALVRLGTSSWTYPGWNGLVWDGAYSETTLSKQGLAAYAQHPLLRSVSLDRAFYRPLSVLQYANYAQQVPDDFRFVVKAPLVVTDALVRSENGQGREPNPVFLNPDLAIHEFVQPALDGLGPKLGALVFQLSPLPLAMLTRMDEVLDRLHALLKALPALAPAAPEGVVAVEVRDPEFLTPGFADVLRDTGATYCLGLHAKLPPLAEQLPLLRALWPGPLVCRWNLNRLHGPYGYEAAEKRYEPYAHLLDPDPDTHAALARVIAGTVGAGQRAYVTISNHAEGSAPRTVLELARTLAAGRG